MKREIKFRAWDKEKKQMVEVGTMEFIAESGWSCYLLEDKFVDDKQMGYYQEAKNIELMQCTGLKDKKGKEVYEGDIVEINHNPEEVDKGSVLYSGSCFQVDFHDESEILEYLKPVEIIGNIYKNPDLLK